MKHNNNNQLISKFKNFLAREGVFPQYFQEFCLYRGLSQHDKRTAEKFNLFLKECDPKRFFIDAFGWNYNKWDKVNNDWQNIIS